MTGSTGSRPELRDSESSWVDIVIWGKDRIFGNRVIVHGHCAEWAQREGLNPLEKSKLEQLEDKAGITSEWVRDKLG